MNVEKIIFTWLKDNGYDGLLCTEGDPCGCHLGDFMPCGGESIRDCRAAYKQTCKRNPESFCMVSRKGIEPNCDNCEV
jgi:hypothetical protein